MLSTAGRLRLFQDAQDHPLFIMTTTLECEILSDSSSAKRTEAASLQ